VGENMVECDLCKELGIKPPKRAVATYWKDIEREELTFVCEEHKEWAEKKGFVVWTQNEFNVPILCPYCNEPLNTVQVQKTVVLEYQEPDVDTEEIPIFVDNGQGAVSIICHKCGKEIGHSDANGSSGMFPKSDDF
jgi:hypothetical protein